MYKRIIVILLVFIATTFCSFDYFRANAYSFGDVDCPEMNSKISYVKEKNYSFVLIHEKEYASHLSWSDEEVDVNGTTYKLCREYYQLYYNDYSQKITFNAENNTMSGFGYVSVTSISYDDKEVSYNELTSTYNDIKIESYSAKTSEYFYSEYEIKEFNFNDEDYAEGSEKYIKRDINDLNTYKINEIQFVYPDDGEEYTLYSSTNFNRYYLKNAQIKGKVYFDKNTNVNFEEFKDMIKQRVYRWSGSVVQADETVLISNTDNQNASRSKIIQNEAINIFGVPQQWAEQGYYTFNYTFDIYFNRRGNTVINCEMQLPTIGTKGMWDYYTFQTLTDNVTFNTISYIDNNGDGLDDVTGEDIPTDYQEGQEDVKNYEDMTLLDKITYIFTGIPSFVDSVFTSVSSAFKSITKFISDIMGMSNSMNADLKSLYNFLPSPMPQLIVLVLSVAILVSMITWIKK